METTSRLHRARVRGTLASIPLDTMAQKQRQGTEKSDPAVAPLQRDSAAPAPAAPDAPCPVVGVGASAGGLEAGRSLLRALPADTGMAFVLVQHLHPGHVSMLSEILARETSMPVTQVEADTLVRPNHVYVIPPGADLMMAGGHLRLAPRRDQPGRHRPIDGFFISLAQDRGYKAVGVVLSGTSTDGTLGLEEIKAAGGITFAQDATAQHDGMPRSAVGAGCVDFVLPPDGIAEELVRIAHHPYIAPPAQQPSSQPQLDLEPVTQVLHHATGVDFTHYKPNTLQRRVARRMVLHRVDDVPRYATLLKSDPGEIESLYQDILIGVTSFFRNPECFEALKTTVFPSLVEGRSRHDPLRVWVLGCSTGEEAYSIAIALAEFLESQRRQIPVQIFGTDVNGVAIEKARGGVYGRAIAEEMAPQRLRGYFVETDGGYRINKSIRDICVFARHNALSEPPFSRIDLVTCRNLLIYLGTDMQQRVLPILHYALKPGGYLLLGASETIGAYRDLFEIEDAKHKIFRKKPLAARPGVAPLTSGYALPGALPERTSITTKMPHEMPITADPYREAERMLLAKYAPPSVLVNGDFDILHFRGDTGPYLSPAPGKASLNLLKMLREGLLVGVRGALYKAKKDEAAVRETGLRVRGEDGYRDVDIEVLPVKGATALSTYYVVLFVDAQRGETASKPAPERPAAYPEGADAEIHRIKQELAATREYLQAVIEQQEAANEELQSANEEVQSTNEELQSINEELETSKEELQSSNEELSTVNEQLHNRNSELAQSNNDIVNLLASVQIAIIMFGPNLTIRRYTPPAEKIFNLIPADVGRPIKDLSLNITIPDLDRQLQEVVDSVTAREFEVRDKHGHWYLLRLRPYRTMENKIDGAVLMLVDTDGLKRGEELLRRQTGLLEQAHEPIIMWDLDGGITYWNKAAAETYGYAQDDALGRSIQELLVTSPPYTEFRDQLLRDGRWSGELVQTRRDGQRIIVESRMAVVRESDDRIVVVDADRPISERKELERVLRRRADDLVAVDRNKDEFLAMLAHELRNPLAPLHNVVAVLRASRDEPEKFDRALDIIQRQIGNMARLLDDLLDVSRMTLGRIELRREVVDVATLAARAADVCRPAIEQRGQALAVRVPKASLHVYVDPMRMEQVLGNLLSNASKYTPRGGHLELSMAGADDLGGQPGMAAKTVEIRVADDGEGIAADLLPHIFTLFTHGGRAVDKTHGGLGIGLTIVRRLVELHGGTVSAHSDGAGKGSDFVIRLPAASADMQPVAAATEIAPTPAVEPCRILLVDDNADAADGAAMALRLHGHRVDVAYDARIAISLAGRTRPDVILLDISMPDMNGFDVARALRRIPGLEKVTIIALSGYGHDDARQRAREAGFDHYLTKPAGAEAIQGLLAAIQSA
jgi:two-component system, chemotaxis family, CheB/CheR fusion protein